MTPLDVLLKYEKDCGEKAESSCQVSTGKNPDKPNKLEKEGEKPTKRQSSAELYFRAKLNEPGPRHRILQANQVIDYWDGWKLVVSGVKADDAARDSIKRVFGSRLLSLLIRLFRPKFVD
ncbi:MAG TPA: hypothetical protein VGS22_27950 [Thermoanaerobaculia bacterium]|jgi:hypothetical protein|nr:hypothetical protein [Thermoanaerobaculia bacterium]